MKREITKIQDEDGHWYWIPNDILDNFREDLDNISGKEYMDCPNDFDNFIDNYDVYRTLGDPDNMPDYFK